MATKLSYRPVDGTEDVDVTDQEPFPVTVYRQNLVTLRQLVARSTGSTAYSANDAVGGMLTFPLFTPGKGGFIETVSIIDLTGQKAALILTLFDQPFTATTDNAAYDVADAAYVFAVATVTVAATDYTDSSAAAIGTIKPALACAPAGGILYGQFEATGTPTYAANNQDLVIVVTARQF